MRADTFTFKADDDHELFVHRFLPDEGVAKRAVVHIAHGMAEHGARYERLAEALTGAGYVIYANDHRGHGRTAKRDEDLGFFGSSRGFRRTVRDIDELVALEKQDNPGLPVILFGHSMGSYMIQRFIIDHGRLVQGAVLSATSGKPNALASAGRLVARAERLRLGDRGRSKLLNDLSFGQFNRAFAPTRTDFDWLSRDPAEVDKYMRDPRCGFICTTSLWVDLLDELAELHRPENQARIPADLPVYLFAGSRDPVGDNTKSIERLIDAYRRAGLRDITQRFYPEGRHEMVNEINRDEVARDLLAWLDRVTKPAERTAP
jgi:alpha-beta hydrolase superfamily lysophospholipase